MKKICITLMYQNFPDCESGADLMKIVWLIDKKLYQQGVIRSFINKGIVYCHVD